MRDKSEYQNYMAELEATVAQFEKMLSVTEEAVVSGNINTAGTNADGGRMCPINENILSELDEWLSLSDVERKHFIYSSR